jgi:unsaturated rhamnogalacturonyl hydrolase
MKSITKLLSPSMLLLIIIPFLTVLNSCSQVVVGLDTWFNHETNSSTGQPFHYLWTDTAMSGFSDWGKIFIKHGAEITTVGKPLKRDLNRIDIYIIVDPDSTSENPEPEYITSEDSGIITDWVRQGGVLVIMANDAPNCEFTHLNGLMASFGMRFNHVSLHKVPGDDFEQGASADLPQNAIFNGVRKIYLKEISDITLWENARPVLTEKGKVLMAETKYGKGYVFAVGDPWIYNEYIDHKRLPAGFDNMKAAVNLTEFLLDRAN